MATVKMSGADFKAYWFADWGAHTDGTDPWVDDEVILVDGEQIEDVDADKIPDNARVEIHDGIITWRYRVVARSANLVTHARNWLKDQNVVRLVLGVQKEDLEMVKTVVSSMKGVKIV